MHILLTQTFCLMCNTQELWLTNNTIGDAGVEALSKACVGGALASCTTLILRENQIGDAGMEAFSGALANGAMAQLQVSWRLTALTPCLEPWQARSLGLTVLFGVPYVPYAGALPRREPYW